MSGEKNKKQDGSGADDAKNGGEAASTSEDDVQASKSSAGKVLVKVPTKKANLRKSKIKVKRRRSSTSKSSVSSTSSSSSSSSQTHKHKYYHVKQRVAKSATKVVKTKVKKARVTAKDKNSVKSKKSIEKSISLEDEKQLKEEAISEVKEVCSTTEPKEPSKSNDVPPEVVVASSSKVEDLDAKAEDSSKTSSPVIDAAVKSAAVESTKEESNPERLSLSSHSSHQSDSVDSSPTSKQPSKDESPSEKSQSDSSPVTSISCNLEHRDSIKETINVETGFSTEATDRQPDAKENGPVEGNDKVDLSNAKDQLVVAAPKEAEPCSEPGTVSVEPKELTLQVQPKVQAELLSVAETKVDSSAAIVQEDNASPPPGQSPVQSAPADSTPAPTGRSGRDNASPAVESGTGGESEFPTGGLLIVAAAVLAIAFIVNSFMR